MRFRVQLFLILASVPQAYTQDCPYQTIAGLSVTFRGDNGPLAAAIFNTPAGVAIGNDGSIYIADTRNHRVRRVDSGGVVHTVAGTGERGFRGDGGPATAAALQSPGGLAIASDGTIYIADTGNQRIRKIAPDGVIQTIAGDGHARWEGDGGPAISASLNTPTQLAVDDHGVVYFLDSGNVRVRRIDTDGTIHNVAGARPVMDYRQNFGGDVVEGSQASTSQALAPSRFGLAQDGVLYINTDSAIWRVGVDGLLQSWLVFDRLKSEKKLDGPVPLSQLSINSGTITVAQDGTVYIDTAVQFIVVRDGVATRVSDPLGFRVLAFFHIIRDSAVDPRTGDVIAVSDTDLIRQASSGSRTVLWAAPAAGTTVPAAAVDFPIQPTAIAVGPDGIIYISESTRILTLHPDGQLRLFAGSPTGSDDDGTPALAARLSSVVSLAVDGNNTVYFAEATLQRVRKIGADGLVREAFSTPDEAASVRVDGQNRVYAFSARRRFSQVIRYAQNGEPTVLITGGFWDSVSNASNAPGMAVARDGTVYIGFLNNGPSVLKIAPDNQVTTLPMEESLFPAGLAITEDGTLYVSSPDGRIKKVLPDGTMVTLRNREGTGFSGERGLDSEPVPTSLTKDLALDGRGGLLAGDSSIRRIALSCPSAPGPSLLAVVESATSNPSLRLSAGQLISLYGSRLGSAAPVTAVPDSKGFYPTQLDGVQVFIDHVAAPLLFAGDKQINAIVPFAVDGHTTVSVEVQRNGSLSDVLTAPLGRIGPAILSYAGPGPIPDLYVRMVNQDGSVNGPNHPAGPGSLVTVFASGLGITDPDGEDGKVADLNLKRPVHQLRLTLQGQSVSPLYAGTAPGIVEGVTQINVRLPENLRTVGCCALIGIGADESVPQPNRLYFYLAP